MMTKFWDWIDDRMIVRRLVLVYTLYMTTLVTYQSWEFAHSSKFDGLGTAAVIAAVAALTAAVQGFAFSQYGKGRNSK